MEVNHTTRCLQVELYETVVSVDENPTATECPFCEMGITMDQDQYTPTAIEIAKLLYTSSKWTEDDLHNALRTLMTATNKRLHKQGHLGEYTGSSVKTVGYWQSERPSTQIKRFDKALADSLQTHLIFDIVYMNYDGFDDIEEYLDLTGFTRSDQNTVKTINWLRKHHTFQYLDEVNEIIQLDIESEDTTAVPERDTKLTPRQKTETAKDQGENEQSSLTAF